MLKFGTISDVDATKGLVRVAFDADENMVSDWLPVLVKKSLTEKESFPLDANEHVVCLMDEHCEHGVCLGSIYSTVDAPALVSKDQFGVKFANGDYMSYDRSSGEYQIKAGNIILTLINGQASIKLNNTMKFVMDSSTGKFDFTNGTISLKQIINDLINAITSMTQAVVGGGGGTTGAPPVNIATFNLIQTQLTSLLN